jgi:hypothetical protein
MIIRKNSGNSISLGSQSPEMNSPFLTHNVNNFSNYSDAPKGDE